MITNEELQLSKMSYTDKDFASIYPDLLDLASQLTNKWDPSLSNESDPGVVLLKEGAFIADHNNYNIDKNVLENFLPSATQDRSVRNITEMNGYTPRYYVSATGDINFTFNGNDEITINNFMGFTIPAYTIVVTNEDEDITYTQVDDLKIGNYGVSSSCKFMEGSLIQLSVNNSGVILLENLDENNRIYFPDQYVAENGIFIHNVESDYHDLWVKNNYLLTQPTGSKIYRVDYDSRVGLPYVEFPDDIANIIGNGLDIRYISTSGTIGNVKANSLIKVKSPTDFVTDNGQEVSLENDFTISNQSSILNGKDPETIDEMYQSFKRIVGTFDTLVTRRDYENAIKGMQDDYNINLVSNAAVTDVRTDYNNIINVVTVDEYGVYYENASLMNGISTYHFTNGSNPEVGDIKYETNKFMICTDNSDPENILWEEITELSYQDFVVASEAMTPYDLSIHALKAFSMSDYIDRDPGLALNKSFTQVNGVTHETIKSELNNYKCINHTFKDPSGDDIFCFKNYVPLNITIIPYSKVTREEKDEIIRNIYRALTEKFNASMVEFGEELNYDEVVEVLLNSDTRIKNIRLEDFEYIPVAMLSDATDIKDGTENKVYENPELLIDLIAKNVLAGRVCLFDFDDTFSYSYGQVGSEYYPNIGTISTEVEIDVPEEPASGGSVEDLGDEVSQIPTSYGTDVSGLIFTLQYPINSQQAGAVVPAWSAALAAGQDYTLPDGYMLTVNYTLDDIADEQNFTADYDGGVYIKIHANSSYLYDPNQSIADPTSVTIITETSTSSSDAGDVDFQYDLKENEYIEITYPNYYSTVIYPTYCNYRFVSPNNTTVYSNTDYKLQQGEYLYIMYTKDDEQQYITYKAGDVIQTTFNMTPTTEKGSKKSFGSNGVQMIMTTLGGGQQIALREKLETKLSGRNTPCYWIMNRGNNTLFKEITDDITQIGEEGYTWVILESGEYFIYSNSNLDSMVILGAGTKITRSDSDKTQWVIPANNTTIESISTNGFNSNITWQYYDFSVNNLIIQELNVVTLGVNDQVSVIDWVDKPAGSEGKINNEWKSCDGTIYYKIDGKQTALKKLNLDDGYQIRSRLDLVTDKYNGQKLLTDGKSRQVIKIKYYTGEESVIEPKESGSSSEASELYVQSTVPLDLIGSENINIDLITSEAMLNFMTFQKKTPKVYYSDGSGGYTESDIPSENGKYIINVEGDGYAEFPFTYDNYFTNYDGASREYVLPVFISGDDYDNPITASFDVDPEGDPDSSSGYDPIPSDVKVIDYNKGTPTSTLVMNNKELYLVTPVVSSGLEYNVDPYDDMAETTFADTYVKGDLILRLEWSAPEGVEVITVYDPKIIRGVNDGIAAVSSVVTLGDILDRIDYLVSHSNKPDLKPYYINEPEQSIAIQDPDFSNPNIFWDKNNVANLITIPQIIIPSENIDIIKSMKGYSLKEEGK